MPKRVYITREDLEHFGFLVECLEYASTLSGTARRAHTENWRKRIETKPERNETVFVSSRERDEGDEFSSRWNPTMRKAAASERMNEECDTAPNQSSSSSGSARMEEAEHLEVAEREREKTVDRTRDEGKADDEDEEQ